ncbi:hypothetical protein QL285_086866 [Trifolium repens]|nr:hypothetical protein QL285_086866 [Trifolium repens]
MGEKRRYNGEIELDWWYLRFVLCQRLVLLIYVMGTFVIYSPLIHTSQLSSVIGPCECQVKAIYKVGVAPSVVAEKVKDGKVSLATDTLQETLLLTLSNTLRLLSPMWTDHMTQLRTSPKKRETWRLWVILDDMCTVYKGDTEDHVELLVRDIKGDTIQATLMQDGMATWKPMLSKGKTYYTRNFRVYDNTSDYKLTQHKFRLTFLSATRIEQVEIPGIPPTLFNFKDFSEIQSGKYKPDLLVDAIGVIHDIRKVVTATPTRKTSVTFTLKDLRWILLLITLFGTLSVEFITSYNQRTDNGPVFNSDEIFIKQTRIVTLGDMKKLKVDTYCVTVVTADKIQVSNQGWFFYRCTECSCKAEGNEPLFVRKKGTRPMNLSSSIN